MEAPKVPVVAPRLAPKPKGLAAPRGDWEVAAAEPKREGWAAAAAGWALKLKGEAAAAAAAGWEVVEPKPAKAGLAAVAPKRPPPPPLPVAAPLVAEEPKRPEDGAADVWPRPPKRLVGADGWLPPNTLCKAE